MYRCGARRPIASTVVFLASTPQGRGLLHEPTFLALPCVGQNTLLLSVFVLHANHSQD